MTIARPTSAPHGTLILDRAHTRAALDPTQVIAAVRTALIAISRDEVSAPPRIAAHTPTGLVGAMPAWLPGTGLGAKLISVFPQPAAPGRSAHEGVVALFDDKTGRLQALINASEITAARTAATATLSMHALASPHPHQIAVIGTGTQATAQLAMLAALDDTIPVTVAGRDPARTAHAATTHPHSTTDTIENAVRGADVIFCCTGARAPVIHRSWIRDGTHISSIGGSDGPEIDPGTIADATLFTEWTGAAHHPPPPEPTNSTACHTPSSPCSAASSTTTTPAAGPPPKQPCSNPPVMAPSTSPPPPSSTPRPAPAASEPTSTSSHNDKHTHRLSLAPWSGRIGGPPGFPPGTVPRSVFLARHQRKTDFVKWDRGLAGSSTLRSWQGGCWPDSVASSPPRSTGRASTPAGLRDVAGGLPENRCGHQLIMVGCVD
ncbi:NAD(P)-binding domain-containing protein [Amycolatopsis sp. EV170708-02-1]|nr:NAD(P)-binding domain-containing protein [Amycolatopsis sp. EV170708-02-1]UMP00062.1 NAD(P)-binding domain-containing protein [Amycolatopsis sp. EV170708-02-1]